MSKLILNLKQNQKQYELETGFSSRQTKSILKFKSECIKAAAQLGQNQDIILFLENTFECLVMLEAFIKARVQFNAVTLTYGKADNPVVSLWKNKLKKFKIELHEFNFDFANQEHIGQIEKLQELEITDMNFLFKLWVRCQLEGFVVFSGDFCYPKEIDPQGTVKSWGLPGKDLLAVYNFSKSLNYEAFFINSTYKLFRSQIDNEFMSVVYDLYVRERRNLKFDRHLIQNELYQFLGFDLSTQFPVKEEKEPAWKYALRLEGRKQNESISAIINKCKFVRNIHVLENESHGFKKPKAITAKQKANSRLYKTLKKVSKSLDVQGAAVDISAHDNRFSTNEDYAYAVFPLLMTRHIWKKDITPILKCVQNEKFYRNTSNFITGNDLHLRPEMSELVGFINSKISDYFKIQGKIVYDFEITQCWANKSNPQQAHHAHNHPNSILGGVFYLNDDGGGDTLFQYEPRVTSVINPCNDGATAFNESGVRIRPRKGQLVLFPAYLSHKVLPHLNQNEVRYTIAFNVFLRGAIGDFNDGNWVDLNKKRS